MVLKVITEAFVPWVTQKATRADLQRVASLIGVPVSGTKPQLSVAIQNAIDTAREDVLQHQTASARLATTHNYSIVSIDMGIRNLAYAHLTSRVEIAENRNSSIVLTTPILQAWRRISVGREVFDAVTTSSSDIEPDASMDEDTSLKQQPEDSFEPVDLAAQAYACGKHIISLNPTHVLIERQRFRSGGHAAVQEWSLRVGVFEGMLYATLKTLAEEGLFRGTVSPMLPARVNRFWLEGFEQNVDGSARVGKGEKSTNTTTRVNGKEAKQAKIDLVAGILGGSESAKSEFEVAEGAMETVDSFMDAYSGTKSRKRQPGAKQPLRKLDDLSDSLLQGLAWFEWQRNRLALQSHNITLIKEEK